jgi:hypothetical protein
MTTYEPWKQTLVDSTQRCVYIQPEPLNGQAIISHTDPIVNLLVEDMGGHGRALINLIWDLSALSQLDKRLMFVDTHTSFSGCYPLLPDSYLSLYPFPYNEVKRNTA